MLEMNEKIPLPPPRVKIWRYMFIVLAWVFFAFIIVQVSLAGLGLFVNGEHWELHRTLAHYFAWIPVGMLVLSFLGKLPVHLRWICLGLYLMIVAQFLTVIYSSHLGILSALHPVIALFLSWGSLSTVKHSHNLGGKKV
ncbi:MULTISPECIES: DUF6220 domain-containing protein [Brevibacillus]|uniref:DUF2569 domain-containing protein n=2 Tax=Brevibacillus porteri TaxID=2126350 RepID=A0ABX5FKF8_9BACL|nr:MULTISPECIES: DUF6220 domain-containing protein [Brevibacillus]MDC0764946.1 DUF6220 domain-containing protein [Brevibacillus sp. AG]MED2129895.1 DUF6220 domain-containing protein [Brevibacillus porteri]MED2815974.1 DUF6220 domain-containing protein [Brevibacillus porteri]MED4898518.1 DUF6220 domain-containing protein [Brevibacillus porteri]PSK05334.1 hypothetical protein C7R92_25835 [Brevibacillus porteri]